MNGIIDRAVIPANVQMGRCGNSVTVHFLGPCNVLSTSWLNGGYRTDLRAVFNHQISLEACEACHNGRRIRTYLEEVASDLGFDPSRVTGLVTRAGMKNTAVVSETFRDLTVAAIVTAGLDRNGGRAGDPASYYENGDTFEPVGGTINTILIIGADLPEHAMSRALMTATEAKAAALQQLMARSIYSTGIATGSGTDMIAIVTDPGSPLHLSDAGKHAKLGELIGSTVIGATIEALEMETGLSAAFQRDVLVRLARFGVTVEDIWNSANIHPQRSFSDNRVKEKFMERLQEQAREPERVALVSAILHIVDEAGWGLIPEDDATRAASRLIRDGFSTERTGINDTGSIIPDLARALAESALQEDFQ
ncbi:MULTISPECIES: adenosylcobinamide amidohydrolase [unclassified Methanoregula]|uniref:adenosylcobinamide amidohydrolase n=1 Tax=unclassified Methanoregula TaxID=2649730 RepID=UPI0009C4A2DA|nr:MULTISPECIES: adenosylcobinamide amidohydrolase [unclassified Methanoregula]OPX64401.1 MAG: Adenosylcobinamide amidohydrolase [Methanoregula sp. PtaB.Bin085]OPY34929.1 MAG: Adenosylcobinamide amidohydrolase [Methanoregula sp. PtaU1.Bin006]